MDKEGIVHIYNEIILCHKKEWHNAICSNMEGPSDDHTKWSKSERQISYDITHMWNLKYDTNEPVYKTELARRHREQTCGCQGGGGRGGMDWELEIHRRKLLYREWVNNKVLLHSTGNYIQYPVINHHGKEYKKECILNTLQRHISEKNRKKFWYMHIYIYIYNWFTLLYTWN